MKTSVVQCRHLLTVAEPILAALDDSHRVLGLDVGNKTAGWLIGHLAVTGDFARRLCGRPPICPAEWRAVFNPGTHPSPNPGDYPPMSALCEKFLAVYDDLCIAAPQADAQLLAKENPYAPGRASFATSGEFVAYLLSGHLGYHVGQLVAWRAATGAK